VNVSSSVKEPNRSALDPVAVEVAGSDGEGVGERAGAVGPVRAEGLGELGRGAGEVVDAERHRGAGERDHRAVGQLGAAPPGRQQLHVAAGDEAGRHHGGLRVGGEAHVRVGDRHVDAHLRALRRDLVDRADGHAEHHHLVVREERGRVGEVRGHVPPTGVRGHGDAGREQHDERAGQSEDAHQQPPGLSGPMVGVGRSPQM
jgi:hypothetical protein